jgi:Domain of unknown function (DUF4336)
LILMALFSREPVTYPPLDVLKPVAAGAWTVDSGPIKAYGLALPVRMTVVRLSSGDLWLHSPTRFDGELKREMEKIGPIRHLVAPNIAHWMHIQEWLRACPEAVTWAAPGLRDRAQVKKSPLRLDRDLGEIAPAEWVGDMDQVVVPGGFGFSEVDFFHKLTRTLILTDLIVNLELRKLPPLVRAGARLIGVVAPNGKAPIYLRMAVLMRRAEAARAAARMIAWAPERVVFSHGRWFDRNGAAELRRAFSWLLP